MVNNESTTAEAAEWYSNNFEKINSSQVEYSLRKILPYCDKTLHEKIQGVLMRNISRGRNPKSLTTFT